MDAGDFTELQKKEIIGSFNTIYSLLLITPHRY